MKTQTKQKYINYQQAPAIVCIGGKWGIITPGGLREVSDYIQPDIGDPFGLLEEE